MGASLHWQVLQTPILPAHTWGMARRSSAASVSVLPPSISAKPAQHGKEKIIAESKPKLDGQAPPKLGRTPSSSASYIPLVGQNGSATITDPDELFLKYTVSEVKAIQKRFRSIDVFTIRCG